MDLTITILTWLLPLLYLAVMVEHGLAFTLRVRADIRSPWLVLIVLVNIAYLALRSAAHGPALGTPPTIPAILALSIAAVYALVELFTRDRRTGVFVLAVVFIFQYIAAMLFYAGGFAGWEALKTPSPWAGLHVILALLSYTALALAAVYGLLYISVRRDLKRHYFGVLYDRLPPLAVLGHMTWHAMLTGFVCMTIALAAGPLMMNWPAGESLPPKLLAKIVIGLAAWIIYAVAIFGKFVRKWDQAGISVFALVGFFIITIVLAVSAIMSDPAA